MSSIFFPVQVGVGCFVLNEAGEVLLVQEKNGPLRGRGGWKLVTGLVDAGEDIVEAAAREACMCHFCLQSSMWCMHQLHARPAVSMADSMVLASLVLDVWAAQEDSHAGQAGYCWIW